MLLLNIEQQEQRCFLTLMLNSPSCAFASILRIDSSYLKMFFGRYQHLVKKYSVSCVYMTKDCIGN